MTPLSLGLIGCGAVTQYCHLPALRRLRNVRVVAVADVDPSATDRAHRATGAERYNDPHALLGRGDVEAVLIALPASCHAAIAATAAAAGKHIYLEKPIATGREEAQALLDTVSRAGVTVAVGFNRRLHPLYLQARAQLQQGTIGPVRHVLTAFCEPAPATGLHAWKRTRASGGGVLLDLASHHIDLLRWFLGDEVAEVDATSMSQESECDSASLRLVMRRGIEAQSFFSFRAGYADVLEFHGEQGTLRIDRHRARFALRVARTRGYGLRSVWTTPTRDVAAWWVRRLVRPSQDPSYHGALRAFVAQLRGGPARTASLADGWRSLEVVLAAEEAARRGSGVRIDA
ncbi:MAG TPA: Gfo/Idh/MocA family oxidoreductase [Gemmatimonadaceae bacterium]